MQILSDFFLFGTEFLLRDSKNTEAIQIAYATSRRRTLPCVPSPLRAPSAEMHSRYGVLCRKGTIVSYLSTINVGILSIGNAQRGCEQKKSRICIYTAGRDCMFGGMARAFYDRDRQMSEDTTYNRSGEAR